MLAAMGATGTLPPVLGYPLLGVSFSGVVSSTVCASSSMSACVAISTPSLVSFSKATAVLPASLLPSNSNVTSTVPSGLSGVNVVVAVISLPAASLSVSPVALSTSLPSSTYSLPGIRFS